MMQIEKELCKRPSIPAEWYQLSLIGSLSFIFYALALYVVPAVLARYILMMPIPLYFALILMVPLIWIASQGMLLFAWLGHEGFHLSLHHNKFISALVGILFASAIPTYFEVGAAISHWNHHRYTNQPSDPDCEIFAPFKGFWSRVLFARVVANFKYIKNTLKMAFNQPLEYAYKFHFREQEVIILAWTNILLSVVWVILYVSVAILDPAAGLVSILLPLVVVFFISALQPYLEHTGTKTGIGRDAKSRISLLYTLLYFGNNFHLEHHLYPGVPCYRLPTVHRWLKEQGFYDSAEIGALVDSSILTPYLQAISDPYPHSGGQDSVSDPMIPVST